MEYLIPIVGSVGSYTVEAPFTTLIVESAAYECVGVRTYGDVLSEGRDPFTTYYAPRGIAREDYDTHVTSGAPHIVSLKSSSGAVIYVPSPYIKAMPMVGGVPYSSTALGVLLGEIPDALDLSDIQDRIKDVVKESLGFDAVITVLRVGDTFFLTSSAHQLKENARQDLITFSSTNYSAFQQERARADALQAENDSLKQVIIDAGIIP